MDGAGGSRPLGRGRGLRRPPQVVEQREAELGPTGDAAATAPASVASQSPPAVSPNVGAGDVTVVASSVSALEISERNAVVVPTVALPLGRGRGRGVVRKEFSPANPGHVTPKIEISPIPTPTNVYDADLQAETRERHKIQASVVMEIAPLAATVDSTTESTSVPIQVASTSVVTLAAPTIVSAPIVPVGAPVLTLKGSDGFTAVAMNRGGMEPVLKHGEKGQQTSYATNFIRIKLGESRGLFEYRVTFDPNIDASNIRKQALNACSHVIGSTKTFDGTTLYVPKQLDAEEVRVVVEHPNVPEATLTITFKLIKQMTMLDSVQFYNVLLNRVNLELGLVEMARNYFDPRITHQIPQHKLEIWPGYATRIEEAEGGLMLCLDASHRVLRQTTVLDLWKQIRNSPGDPRTKFKEFMVGQLVMTKYNYGCHRIDDVSFLDTPLSTFTRREDEITYVKYYKEHYNLTITDTTQPMLISKPKARKRDKPGTVRLCILVPEFCYMSGLSADQTSNFTLMKDVAQFTRITPQQRVNTLMKYMENIRNSEGASKILKEWGLELEAHLLKVDGRKIQPPTLEFNPNLQLKNAKADFSREATNNVCYRPVTLKKYIVLCSRNDRQKVEAAMRVFRQVCGPLGMNHPTAPEIVTTNGNYPKDFKAALQQYVSPDEVQFVIVVMPAPRDDVYKAVKEYCVVENVIPSQVILMKTLNNEKRQRSVMQKVALQINCKLGGALWSLKIPLSSKIMFVGIDVYHDPKRRSPSVTAVVATLDTECTKYYSRTIFQKPHQESVDSLVGVMVNALEEFREVNGVFPDRVVVFRDGVSDGQMGFIKDTESQQIMTAFKLAKLPKTPSYTFCVVQKKISERFFAIKGNSHENPEPGSVLDTTVTRKYFFDFFIVSQLVREGTVSPTHYVVVDDNSDIKPDLMQKFAFSSTFMYFNWPGTIRVPAMCQYAHKLAYLAGQTLLSEPHEEHSRSLYYL